MGKVWICHAKVFSIDFVHEDHSSYTVFISSVLFPWGLSIVLLLSTSHISMKSALCNLNLAAALAARAWLQGSGRCGAWPHQCSGETEIKNNPPLISKGWPVFTLAVVLTPQALWNHTSVSSPSHWWPLNYMMNGFRPPSEQFVFCFVLFFHYKHFLLNYASNNDGEENSLHTEVLNCQNEKLWHLLGSGAILTIMISVPQHSRYGQETTSTNGSMWKTPHRQLEQFQVSCFPCFLCSYL